MALSATLFLSLAVALGSSAAELPRVVPVDGEPFSGQLTAVDAAWRLTFATDGQGRTLPAADLLAWGKCPEVARRPLVVGSPRTQGVRTPREQLADLRSKRTMKEMDNNEPSASTLDRLEAARARFGLRVHGVLAGDRETLGLLEVCDHIHWVRDWRRYADAAAGGDGRGFSPVHSRSLTAMYFPGALSRHAARHRRP